MRDHTHPRQQSTTRLQLAAARPRVHVVHRHEGVARYLRHCLFTWAAFRTLRAHACGYERPPAQRGWMQRSRHRKIESITKKALSATHKGSNGMRQVGTCSAKTGWVQCSHGSSTVLSGSQASLSMLNVQKRVRAIVFPLLWSENVEVLRGLHSCDSGSGDERCGAPCRRPASSACGRAGWQGGSRCCHAARPAAARWGRHSGRRRDDGRDHAQRVSVGCRDGPRPFQVFGPAHTPARTPRYTRPRKQQAHTNTMLHARLVAQILPSPSASATTRLT